MKLDANSLPSLDPIFKCDIAKDNSSSDTKIFIPMSLMDTYLLQFTTFSWHDLAVQAHVENIRSLEVTKDPNLNDLFEATKKWSSIGSQGHETMEIKVDSMQKDGTQSWIVISRSVNKYLTELSKKNKKPIHF